MNGCLDKLWNQLKIYRDCNEKNDPSILSCGAFSSDFSPNLHKIQSNLALVNFSRNTKSLLMPGVYY